MSPRSKKSSPNLQQAYDAIMELLSGIKPRIEGVIKRSKLASIDQDLHKVANMAETFSEQRTRSTKGLAHLADSLDQEGMGSALWRLYETKGTTGVNLWNISSLISKVEERESRVQVAAIRFAAFRLVEAGFETKPGIESLLHILQMASKTGLSLSEAGNNVLAASVLTSAAKFEEMLRNSSDPEGVHRQSVACATVMYLSSRMEAAWNEGNFTVAEFMSKKIADDTQRLAILPPPTCEYLASKLHIIGKCVLKEPKMQASDALEWLQRALGLVDKLDGETALGILQLKVSILRTLARAYFLAESYDRAEAVLDELIPTVDTAGSNGKTEYQELRWLRLAVLKRRKARESALLDAFKSIIDHMAWSEINITDVLQELRSLSDHYTLAAAVHHHCLQRAIQCNDADVNHADKLTLSIIFHCSKDKDHSRAIQTLNDAFTLLSEPDIDLGGVATTACLTLIWQSGSRYYKEKKWSQAADWFLIGGHQFFKNNSPGSIAKSTRKAALCYIEQREYAKASTIVRRCPMNEATTHYVIFLTALHQGLEDEAIRSIRDMQAAPDFDRKMLLLATQISHRSEMKNVLLSVLEGLLKTLKIGSSGEIVTEAMTLLRCIIKLVQGLVVEHGANKAALIDTLVGHFRTAKILTVAACEQKSVSLILKDISWLWRSAYNCAVQGCSEWEDRGEQISELFDIARILLKTCWQSSPVDIDNTSFLYLIKATFAAACGRVFSAREMIAASGAVDLQLLRSVTAEIKTAKSIIADVLSKGKLPTEPDNIRGEGFLHTLTIFEVESFVHLKEWDQISLAIQEFINKSGPPAAGTYEAIADLLWMDKDCPFNVLQECLEAILIASLEHNSLSVERFSRWLRAICGIVLVRDTPEDRVKAFGYFEQAVTVIEEHDKSEEPYPMDERQWLLGTACNVGMECLHASLLDEAKRWFEIALSMCRFVPAGKERAEKISESYVQLLARYQER